MKCPSLFHFYRAYYGGASQGKIHFAKAIAETGRQLEVIFMNRDLDGYNRYASREYGYALTKGFLRNFFDLAHHHYGIGNREVYIPFTYCYCDSERRMIFLEYGKVDDAARWLPIFKTLVESFPMDDTMPHVQSVVYWDLMKGTTMELSYPDSFLAPKERILQIARRLVESATSRRG